MRHSPPPSVCTPKLMKTTNFARVQDMSSLVDYVPLHKLHAQVREDLAG